MAKCFNPKKSDIFAQGLFNCEKFIFWQQVSFDCEKLDIGGKKYSYDENFDFGGTLWDREKFDSGRQNFVLIAKHSIFGGYKFVLIAKV